MTGLSLPVALRRFLAMLWLSAALHAVVIALTRLPPAVVVNLPTKLEVQLENPAPHALPTAALPEAKPTPKSVKSLPPAPKQLPQTQTVIQSVPQPLVPAAEPSPPAIPTPAQDAPATTISHESPGPQLNIPLAVDSRYYTAKELDVQPSALRRPEPVYPVQADEQDVAGHLVIRLHLEADGSVSRIEVVSVAPGGVFGELFKKSTLDSVKTIRFRPAIRNGQPVRSVVEIPVVFEPDR